MNIRIVRKETHKPVFMANCDEYSTFYQCCQSISNRFRIPLTEIAEWVNEECSAPLELQNDKFIFTLSPTVLNHTP